MEIKRDTTSQLEVDLYIYGKVLRRSSISETSRSRACKTIARVSGRCKNGRVGGSNKRVRLPSKAASLFQLHVAVAPKTIIVCKLKEKEKSEENKKQPENSIISLMQMQTSNNFILGCVGFPNRCNKTATAATITLSTSCRSCCTGRAPGRCTPLRCSRGQCQHTTLKGTPRRKAATEPMPCTLPQLRLLADPRPCSGWVSVACWFIAGSIVKLLRRATRRDVSGQVARTYVTACISCTYVRHSLYSRTKRKPRPACAASTASAAHPQCITPSRTPSTRLCAITLTYIRQ